MTWRDFQRRQCVYQGRTIHLPRQEREVLATLLINRGRPVSRDELIEELYPNPDLEADWSRNVICVLLYRLRKLLPGLIQRDGGCRDSRGWIIELPAAELRAAA